MIVALLLRVVALDRYPLPMHQDEITDVYDGYSLVTTGADRHGDRWPVILRSMGPGDYHPALYAYISMLPTALAGFSVWAARLPAALAGVISVWLVYLVARRQIGRAGAVLALLLVTFSPIHLLYSRQAHTGLCMVPLFTILFVYLLQRPLDGLNSSPAASSNRVGVIAAGLVAGFSTMAYGALRLSAPLFVLLGDLLLVVQVGRRQRAWKRAALLASLFSAAAVVGATPQIYALLVQTEEFFSRASTVVYPLGNGVEWWARKLVANLALNLDPRFLFLSFGEYHHLAVARLSFVSLPFLYLGIVCALVWIWRRRSLFAVLLLTSIVICLIPAAASKPNPNTMRSSGVWVLYPIVTAMGVLGTGAVLRSILGRVARSYTATNARRTLTGSRAAAFATASVSLAIAAAGLFNIVRYLRTPEWHGLGAQNHLVLIGEWLHDHGQGYDRVYVDAPGHFAYLYVAAFAGMTPAEFQTTPREGIVTRHGWERFHRFGRYHFADGEQALADWVASDRTQRWLFIKDRGQAVEVARQNHRGLELRADRRPAQTQPEFATKATR